MPHTTAELEAAMASGQVFSRSGYLQLSKSLDVEWQRRVLLQADRVRRFVADRVGHDAFFVYGTLLGAIREGGFIGHDSDLDLAYVSDHRKGAEVARELRDIAFGLIDEGFRIRCFATHLRVSSEIEGVDDVAVDLFHTWFDEGEVLRFPYGVAGVGEIRRSQWRGVREMHFAGGRGLLPVVAEDVAEVLYGSGWRQPQPGFSWHRDRTSRGEAALGPRGDASRRSTGRTSTRTPSSTSGSTFFDAVDAHGSRCRPPSSTSAAVTAATPSRTRRRVARSTGVDRSEVAVRATRRPRRRSSASTVRLTFVAADVADAAGLDRRPGSRRRSPSRTGDRSWSTSASSCTRSRRRPRRSCSTRWSAAGAAAAT